MASKLSHVLRPSALVGEQKLYSSALLLALTEVLSSEYRDFEIYHEVGEGHLTKLSKIVAKTLSGEFTPSAEVLKAVKEKIEDPLNYHGKVFEEPESRFQYLEPTAEGEQWIDYSHKDQLIPESFVARFVGRYFARAKRCYLRSLVEDSFAGSVGERLNGLKLRFYDRRSVQFQPSHYGGSSGFYLYSFISEENNLIIWRTGKHTDFLRDGVYTLIGGKISKHNVYDDGPKETFVTRAKFFDNQTGDEYSV